MMTKATISLIFLNYCLHVEVVFWICMIKPSYENKFHLFSLHLANVAARKCTSMPVAHVVFLLYSYSTHSKPTERQLCADTLRTFVSWRP